MLVYDVGPDLNPAVQGFALECAVLWHGNNRRHLAEFLWNAAQVADDSTYGLQGVGEGEAHARFEPVGCGFLHVPAQDGRVGCTGDAYTEDYQSSKVSSFNTGGGSSSSGGSKGKK